MFFTDAAADTFTGTGKFRVDTDIPPLFWQGNAQCPENAVINADTAGAAELFINARPEPEGSFYRAADLSAAVTYGAAWTNPAADPAFNTAERIGFMALSPFT